MDAFRGNVCSRSVRCPAARKACRNRAKDREPVLSTSRIRPPEALGRTHRAGRKSHALQSRKRQPADRTAPVQPDAQDLRRARISADLPDREIRRGASLCREPENVAYLRPKPRRPFSPSSRTCSKPPASKSPFGIAQMGKAFRNEINPRNFTFRSREFEQMELEFFIKPDEAVEAICGSVAKPAGPGHPGEPQPNWGWQMWHQYWVEERIRYYENIGLPRTTLEEYWQKPEELAHYARATVDLLFKFPFGTQELEGIAARSDFDLASTSASRASPWPSSTKTSKPPGRSSTTPNKPPSRALLPGPPEVSHQDGRARRESRQAGARGRRGSGQGILHPARHRALRRRGPAGAGPDLQRLLRRPGARTKRARWNRAWS